MPSYEDALRCIWNQLRVSNEALVACMREVCQKYQLVLSDATPYDIGTETVFGEVVVNDIVDNKLYKITLRTMPHGFRLSYEIASKGAVSKSWCDVMRLLAALGNELIQMTDHLDD